MLEELIMATNVKIRRFVVNKVDVNLKDVLNYFNRARWVMLKQDKLYRTKYASTYFEISENDKDYFFDIWVRGAFGVIMNYQNNIIGIFDNSGFVKICNEFLQYLNSIGIIARETIVDKKGVSQTEYLICAMFFIVVLGVSVYLLF